MALKLERAQALKRYQALFEESLDAVSVINRDLRFIEANPRVLETYGAESTEAFLQLQPLDFSPKTQPDGRPSAEVALKKIKEAFEKGSVEFEYLHRRLDTGEPWLGKVSLRRIEIDSEPVLIAVVRDITERRRYEQRINDLAYKDRLTGLPNREAAQEHLHLLLKDNSGKTRILVNLDIDNFRFFNEAFGQGSGDQLICCIADAINATLPPAGWLSRLDSDEFLAVIPARSEDLQMDARRWAMTLRQRTSAAVAQQNSMMPRTSLSAGCAIASDSSTADALSAMQEATPPCSMPKKAAEKAWAFIPPLFPPGSKSGWTWRRNWNWRYIRSMLIATFTCCINLRSISPAVYCAVRRYCGGADQVKKKWLPTNSFH